MALDSKQKRGSAMLVGMPFRTWLTEPTGTVSVGPRLSLLRLCSAVTPAVAANALIPQSQSRRVRALRRM